MWLEMGAKCSVCCIFFPDGSKNWDVGTSGQRSEELTDRWKGQDRLQSGTWAGSAGREPPPPATRGSGLWSERGPGCLWYARDGLVQRVRVGGQGDKSENWADRVPGRRQAREGRRHVSFCYHPRPCPWCLIFCSVVNDSSLWVSRLLSTTTIIIITVALTEHFPFV